MWPKSEPSTAGHESFNGSGCCHVAVLDFVQYPLLSVFVPDECLTMLTPLRMLVTWKQHSKFF